MAKKQFKKKEPRKQPEGRQNYEKAVLESEKFKAYYRAQLTHLTEQEFEQLFEILKTPLPVSFRITGSKTSAFQLRDFLINTMIPKVQNIEIDGKPIPPPFSVNWYPNELCWQFDAHKTQVRRSPELKEFNKFLVAETEIGNISRQELVSMIPPILLKVEPGHAVLDMCASPGSKTAQLLEFLHADGEGLPSGVCVANDASYDRCYTLVHQAKRLQSPCLIVTNHNGQEFPRLKKPNSHVYFQFDRILCDVPCSGDGTIRKNPNIYKSWNPSDGNGLHKLQLQILDRAVQLLKVGGRVVYSTCTFNPVENEAVVASMLKQAEGALKLVDVSEELLDLKRYPGLSNWQVQRRDGEFQARFEDNPEFFVPTMFPPQEIESFGMEKCLRIYPFSQNTGGFFVAVLEKVGDYGALDKRNKMKEEAVEESDEEPEQKKPKIEEEQPKKKGKFAYRKEDPFVYLKDDHPVLKICKDNYGLPADFAPGQFLIRTEKVDADFTYVYLVSELVKQVMQSDKLKVINTGVKAFKRNGGDKHSELAGGFRLVSEGISTIAPYLSEERHLRVSLEDLLVFLKQGYPKIQEFTEPTQKAMEHVKLGSCMLEYVPEDGSPFGKLTLPFFRAKVSCSLLLGKFERNSLLYRLTGETFELDISLERENDKNGDSGEHDQ
ncbi:S-adenosyl-L-methionine-dependent methyltransferase [Gorgonomyces haynaldii]|nr:S-adenosyl-L-methionine-dependent methyltransferase [Gorgonomyces haynaldii]